MSQTMNSRPPPVIVEEERPQTFSKTQRYDRTHLEAPKPIPKPRDEKFFVASQINQRELDSSSYRLSRVPQKFTSTKMNKGIPPQSFVDQYYSNNPNAQVDTRTPKEKLEDLKAKLGEENEESDPQEKLDLIVQQKTLSSLVYGETSVETIRSLIAMGAFYNTQYLPESAMRHLKKAKGITGSVQTEDKDLLRLHVEITDSKMQTPSNTPKQKLYSSFEKILSPYKETITEDKKLAYRRNLYMAEIYYYQNKFEEAIPFYESASEGFSEANTKKEQKPQLATLLIHEAECYHGIEDKNKEKESYEKAIDVYKELEMKYDVDKYQKIVDELQKQIEEEEKQKEEEEKEKHEEEEQKQEETPKETHVVIEEPVNEIVQNISNSMK
ncbi:hypothetical protein TVAG_373590 [Trichomonas vaginalis G3]|uniref:TPR Domain containing protein n=1 Tax=Trichomonas vaginalis (strain ATCC PRA-98 / G3) TaxID=412133 RepID=A2FQQ1_TRIV3|nr:TPR-like family [Trichomonas vaginalis G3]EAX92760.1 hypothetical protein TVAG_373590 [Trichomonas vaginalis G3]KAI5498746.1 TPR-like family [Trichomonas vaginalis G3]|eukprot:XP_001305690.1 hypothetical protein [Trichomonas vaginalis G3]